MAEKNTFAEKNLEIRLLRADEIECRIGTLRKDGLSLLLYKDARVDQNILDETFGILGWKREHRSINGLLFCTVSIRDENGEWVSKEDVGTPSYAESEKGAASDSFKRACFNVGIGRELYTAPFIWIPAGKVQIEEKDGKLRTKDRFYVASISYQRKGRLITALSIKNQRGEIVYSIGTSSGEGTVESEKGTASVKKAEASSGRKKKRKLSADQFAALSKEMKRTGVSEWDILQRYNIPSLSEMDEKTYQRAMEALRKTKDKAA